MASSDIDLTSQPESHLLTHHSSHVNTNQIMLDNTTNRSTLGTKDNPSDNINNSTNNGSTAAAAATTTTSVRHLEPRPFRPFKSSEEYLYAMKEDLAEWLNALYNLNITVDNFMEKLETGVILCRHANNIIKKAKSNNNNNDNNNSSSIDGSSIPIEKELSYRVEVTPGTFHARDNVSNFISWCRKLGIMECLLFETDDLVLRKNEKSFILCLLEIARRGSKIGIIAPMLVQLEQEIDREIAQDEVTLASGKSPSSTDSSTNTTLTTTTIATNTTTTVQSKDNDEDKENNRKQQFQSMKNLHEMVVDILNRCSCPSKFPMIKVADGKYRIGDTKVLIFVRILRNHVMVRVGGGWDTLGHYLDRHDPCRCRAGHRFSTSAKLTFTEGDDPSSGPRMVVTYNRSEEPTISVPPTINQYQHIINTPNGGGSSNMVMVNGNGQHAVGHHLNGRSSSMLTTTNNYYSPSHHHLKRRNSGPVVDEYINSLAATSQPNNGVRNMSNSSTATHQARREVALPQGFNGSSRFSSTTATTSSSSSTLSNNNAISSSAYPEVLIIDRQESRTSHYSDDSTDSTSSVIMESPSPTQCEQRPNDDNDDVDGDDLQSKRHQQQQSTSSNIKSNKDKTTTTINANKTSNVGSSPLTTAIINQQSNKTLSRGTYHDSSSSEFSESEINHTPAISLTGGSRTRRCSPRKIMKTSDLLGTEKPSWASDDFKVDNPVDLGISNKAVNNSNNINNKSTRAAANGLSSDGLLLSTNSSPFQRNCRYRRSEQKISTRGTGERGMKDKDNRTSEEDRNKSRSSEDLTRSGESKMKWKNPTANSISTPLSSTSSPNRKVASHLKGRNSTDVKETPMSCFERGRNYYASLPRSRSSSQSARIPLSDHSVATNSNNKAASPFVRGSPGRYSLNTPRGSLTESISLGSCRSDRFGYGSSVSGRLCRQNSENGGETLRTWTFKSRTRPALDPDLFNKPCESSRTPLKFVTRPTQRPNAMIRSRSSDSSPSRVPLANTSSLAKVVITNGGSANPNIINTERQKALAISDVNNNNSERYSSPSNNDNIQGFKESRNAESESIIHHNHSGDSGDEFNLQNDILKKMENLVNQYQTRVERALPCKIVNNTDNNSDNSSESINLLDDSDEYGDVDVDGIQSNNEMIPVINCSQANYYKCNNNNNSSKIPMPIRSTPQRKETPQNIISKDEFRAII